ncbi:phage holin family protein [Rubrobacter aplysinae]|uniref:phage holin family protein n=1 Tax=Rubrobacter aplysinae TaxID=909625 RepID=UPI001364A30F|nr:phage holin family protein [Rubrobacter aplysinae]
MAERQDERVAEFARELREGPEPSDRSLKEIVNDLRPQLQELAGKQVELAKTELAPVGKKAGIATGLLVAGAVFMLVFLIFLSLTGVYLFGQVLGLGLTLGALIVTVILLLVGGALLGVGAVILRGLDPKPRRTINALQQNVEWIKGRIR